MVQKSGIGSHTLPNKDETDDWITPKYIIDELGPFELDPCQSLTQPWPCAVRGYTIRDNGLAKNWPRREMVYLNAPYSNAEPFMQRLAEHKNGIALLFGRTETAMFRSHIWQEADAVLFVAGRLHFCYPDPLDPVRCLTHDHVWTGRPENDKKLWCPHCGTAKGNSGGPSCIVAYGGKAVQRLRDRIRRPECRIRGAFVTAWEYFDGVTHG